MQRYNLFRAIHKGLRALLYDTALYLQQTEFTERRQSNTAIEKINLVLGLFESHTYYQQNYILPALQKFDRLLVADYMLAHKDEKSLAEKLKRLVTIFKNSISEEEQGIAGSAIIKAFMDFLIFSLSHMAKEESQLNQALWKHYTNSELLAIEQEIIDSVPNAKMAIYGKWMIKGMSDSELIRWFGKMKGTAPEFLFHSLLTLTEIELPSSRWNKIEEAIAQEVQAA